jgi:hypothetical protein
MVPALLLTLLSTAGAADLAIVVRSPEGDFGSVAMALEAGSTPPAMLPLTLKPPVDARRSKAIYRAETGLEPMGPTLGVTVKVYKGEAENREMVLDAALLVAPGGDATFRTGEWVVDVSYKDALADDVLVAPAPVVPAPVPR